VFVGGIGIVDVGIGMSDGIELKVGLGIGLYTKMG
jgi:hypothetical protein